MNIMTSWRKLQKETRESFQELAPKLCWCSGTSFYSEDGGLLE